LLAWVEPPHWPTNPRWWHHADRVVGYLIALIVVFFAVFSLFFADSVSFCQ
jgi:hypothetical protein